MNEKSIQVVEKFVPRTYAQQGHQSLLTAENDIRILLEHCKMPEKGWSDQRIELLLQHLSLMDSNNFAENCGVGEREGRIFSNLVAKRNFYFAHGIGRSGDLVEVQPKAVGSSIVNKLTNLLLLDALRIFGLNQIKSCVLFPMATGATLTFCMLSIRETKPVAKYVLMPRIDQKSCIKSAIAAGYSLIIIENELNDLELRTDLKTLEDKIQELKPENIACIFSTSSCFAPRAPDRVEEIAVMCKKYDIFHLINNAYGLQSSKSVHMINQAARNGRVDLVVQSTDKNIMVPVGGAIVAAFQEAPIKRVSQLYPGRASSSQSLDVLITLLGMGSSTLKKLLDERKECFVYLKDKVQEMASKYGERVIHVLSNQISLGMSLKSFESSGRDEKELTKIGAMLFTRNVSGVRVVSSGLGNKKLVAGLTFENFGSHSNNYPVSYLTCASAMGIVKSDVELFTKRLDKVLQTLSEQKKES